MQRVVLDSRSYYRSFGHLFTSFIDRWSNFTPLQASQNRWKIKLDSLNFVCKRIALSELNLSCVLLTVIIACFPVLLITYTKLQEISFKESEESIGFQAFPDWACLWGNEMWHGSFMCMSRCPKLAVDICEFSSCLKTRGSGKYYRERFTNCWYPLV